MEFYILRKFIQDKEIVNPVNQEEVFSCNDLVNDYKVCKKERKMELNREAKL